MMSVGCQLGYSENGSSRFSLWFFLFVNVCGNVKKHGMWNINFRKKIRTEESDGPLSCELVPEVALPPVRRVHLVQDRVLAERERIVARVRDSAAGLPLEGSHER